MWDAKAIPRKLDIFWALVPFHFILHMRSFHHVFPRMLFIMRSILPHVICMFRGVSSVVCASKPFFFIVLELFCKERRNKVQNAP